MFATKYENCWIYCLFALIFNWIKFYDVFSTTVLGFAYFSICQFRWNCFLFFFCCKLCAFADKFPTLSASQSIWAPYSAHFVNWTIFCLCFSRKQRCCFIKHRQKRREEWRSYSDSFVKSFNTRTYINFVHLHNYFNVFFSSFFGWLDLFVLIVSKFFFLLLLSVFFFLLYLVNFLVFSGW